MKTALLVSPHLDDVAFSMSRSVIRMARRGYRCVVATVFTRSIADPSGFALRCQTDKGIPPGTDYMAIRRREDARYAATINRRLTDSGDDGSVELCHGDLPEAPHRGYGSPGALFGDAVPEDQISNDLGSLIEFWMDTHRPDVVFGPMGFGRHIDHRRVIDALDHRVPRRHHYRDTPYVLNRSDARPVVATRDLIAETIDIDAEDTSVMLDAIAAYRTQLPFQFGGEAAMRTTMSAADEITYRHHEL